MVHHGKKINSACTLPEAEKEPEIHLVLLGEQIIIIVV